MNFKFIEQVRRCKTCNGMVHESPHMDSSICEDCNAVNGGSYYAYETEFGETVSKDMYERWMNSRSMKERSLN